LGFDRRASALVPDPPQSADFYRSPRGCSMSVAAAAENYWMWPCRLSHAAPLASLISGTEANRCSWCWPAAVGITAARPRNLTANATKVHLSQLDFFQTVTRPGHSPAQLARTRGDRGASEALLSRSIMDGKFRPGPT
jgi:hypothetical protein